MNSNAIKGIMTSALVAIVVYSFAFFVFVVPEKQKAGVLIQTKPGSVVHIEASESAIVTTSYPITFVPEPMAHTTEAISVFAGPGDYVVIGNLQEGEVRRIIQKSSDEKWLQICCVGGQVAWISIDKIEIDGSVQNLPTYIPLKKGK